MTGVFYHPSFSRRSYLTIGNRLRDFPAVLDDLLSSGKVRMYESRPVKRELLLGVHHPEMIGRVNSDPYCSTAWESTGGVVEAAEEIFHQRLRNAFVLIGAGGHHAGRNSFWGACCFNDVAVAVARLRQLDKYIRIAILDTDAHHGDGTRELLYMDPRILHFCVCHMDYRSPDGLKIDVSFMIEGRENPDSSYFKLVRERFVPELESFNPDMLIWYFGYDTHEGDYGSVGLTGKVYFKLAELLIGEAERLCGGKLEVVLGGGSRPDTAAAVIPGIISMMAEASRDSA